jgi:hypothetical protein
MQLPTIRLFQPSLHWLAILPTFDLEAQHRHLLLLLLVAGGVLLLLEVKKSVHTFCERNQCRS